MPGSRRRFSEHRGWVSISTVDGVGVRRGVLTAESLVGAAATTCAGLRISGDVRMYIKCQGEG